MAVEASAANPSLRLFGGVTPDPLGLIDGSSRYAYAGSSPHMYTDPRGEAIALAVPIGIGIGAGIRLGARLGMRYGKAILGGMWDRPILQDKTDEDGPFCPIPIPDDPASPPTPDFEWKGRGAPGTQGNWVNPDTGEKLNPDMGHGPPIGPHWDYDDGNGGKWRVNPKTGKMTPK